MYELYFYVFFSKKSLDTSMNCSVSEYLTKEKKKKRKKQRNRRTAGHSSFCSLPCHACFISQPLGLGVNRPTAPYKPSQLVDPIKRSFFCACVLHAELLVESFRKSIRGE